MGGGVSGDFGVLSPEAMRGERGGEPSGPDWRDTLLLLRSSFPSAILGDDPASMTTLSALATSLAHVTMSVFNSFALGNFPSEQDTHTYNMDLSMGKFVAAFCQCKRY